MDAIYSYSKERRQMIDEVKKKYRRRERLQSMINKNILEIELLEYKQENYFNFEDEYKEIECVIKTLKEQNREMKKEVAQYSLTKLSSKYGFCNDVIKRIGTLQYHVDGDL